jgi:predicted kinase
MSQTLFILQGVPGSGKSTLAAYLCKYGTTSICSTDYYFIVDGEYKFDPSKLAAFHEANQAASSNFLKRGYSVIVDNTNIKRIHAKPYVKVAYELGIPVVFIRVNGPFKSTHGVPESTIERMRNEMEDLTLESVLAAEEQPK